MVVDATDLLKLHLLLLVLQVAFHDSDGVRVGEHFFHEIMHGNLKALRFEARADRGVRGELLSADEALFTKYLAPAKEEKLHLLPGLRLICD